jgi:histidyl-tRNA synthetase
MAPRVNTQPPKGTRDFLPIDVRRREHVTGIIRRVYESHGFEPLETPAFERLDALLGKYGEEGDQLLFKVLHRGQALVHGIRDGARFIAEPGNVMSGRSGEVAPGAEKLLADMGLRYDLTVPLARVVAEYQGKLQPIFKRYQIQPVWRADTPGKGRFREFYQCDVDVVGTTSRLAEAEVIGAVGESLAKLGFESFEIRINHRKLLRALIEHAGIPVALESAAIVAVDKLDKIQRDGVDKELSLKGIADDARQKLLDIVAVDTPLSLDQIAERLAGHEGGLAAIQDLRTIFDLVASTDARRFLTFNVSLARGLGYYTGAIFEIAVPDLAGSLGGGGRYDGLVGMFSGREIPAVGFSLGLERLLVEMQERGMFRDLPVSNAEVLLACPEPGAEPAALELASMLRSQGVKVDLQMKESTPGLVRQAASAHQIPFAAWVRRDPSASYRFELWSLGSATKDPKVLTREELIAEIVRDVELRRGSQ